MLDNYEYLILGQSMVKVTVVTSPNPIDQGFLVGDPSEEYDESSVGVMGNSQSMNKMVQTTQFMVVEITGNP